MKPIVELIHSRESELLEHKREWPDLGTTLGKAEFVKDVLAIANTVQPESPGFLIYGVADKSEGGGIVGVGETQSEERIQQILSAFTSPVPSVTLSASVVDGRTIDVVNVRWSQLQPYFSTREIPGSISNSIVYIRRGPTIGHLSLSELADALRRRETRLGPYDPTPIAIGFVDVPKSTGTGELVARISNQSDQPVSSVCSIMDFVLFRRPDINLRQKSLVNATLQPSESREIQVNLWQLPLYGGGELPSQQLVWARWLDVKLYVQYRDLKGLIHELRSSITIAD